MTRRRGDQQQRQQSRQIRYDDQPHGRAVAATEETNGGLKQNESRPLQYRRLRVIYVYGPESLLLVIYGPLGLPVPRQ